MLTSMIPLRSIAPDVRKWPHAFYADWSCGRAAAHYNRSMRYAASLGLFLASGVAVAGLATKGSANPTSPTAPVPVLVELFTAEGCSSCPPADRLLEAMVGTQPTAGVQIVGLGEHVDYWDRLGWKDRFSSAALTARQQAYADRLKLDNIYTPQLVVDGAAAFVGSDVNAARRALDEAARRPHGTVTIEVAPSTGSGSRELPIAVSVADLPPIDSGDRAEVMAAIIEDGLRSDVKRGENAGRVLTHAAVVRTLTAIGDVPPAGVPVRGTLKIGADWNREQLKIVSFVQERRGRRVLATGVARVERGQMEREASAERKGGSQ